MQARLTGDPVGWERAASGFAAMGAHGYAAEAATGAAAAYRRAGSSRDAARLDGFAGTHLARTTALATLDRAQGRELALLRGANVVMPNVTPLPFRALYEIYPEIARLAAGHLSNRQIAEQLVVSERTVENHLYRIFIKLAVTGRDDLAAALAAAEQG